MGGCPEDVPRLELNVTDLVAESMSSARPELLDLTLSAESKLFPLFRD